MQPFPPVPTHATIPAVDCLGTPVRVGSIVVVAREDYSQLKQVPGVVTQILPTRVRVHTNAWFKPEWPEREYHDLLKHAFASVDRNLSPDDRKPFEQATAKMLDFTDPADAKGIARRYSVVTVGDSSKEVHVAIIEGYGSTISDRNMSQEHFTQATGMPVLGEELTVYGWHPTWNNKIVDSYISRKKLNEMELGEYINHILTVDEFNAIVNPKYARKRTK